MVVRCFSLLQAAKPASHTEPRANYAANCTRSRTALPGRRKQTQLECGLQKRQHLSQSAKQPASGQSGGQATVAAAVTVAVAVSVAVAVAATITAARAYDVDCSGSSDDIVGGSVQAS